MFGGDDGGSGNISRMMVIIHAKFFSSIFLAFLRVLNNISQCIIITIDEHMRAKIYF
jgi:hypothetical protein